MMMFSSSAARIVSRRIASSGVKCLSTSAKSAPRSLNSAMPVLLAGGLAAVGITQYNNSEKTQCFVGGSNKKVEEAVKAVEDKFVNYWPRNIMVSGCPALCNCHS